MPLFYIIERSTMNYCFSYEVHMGTHMWSGGASRRGRRMSLELPPRPMHEPHDLLRRPDLFYPYLPAPFLNGMQQKVLNQSTYICSIPYFNLYIEANYRIVYFYPCFFFHCFKAVCFPGMN